MANNKAWPGWILFAGTMLLVVGVLNVIEGIVALSKPSQVVFYNSRLYLFDVTSWGWTVLLSGVVLGATGLGLLAGQTWARVTAIVVIILHAIEQIFWIGAYPVWSVLMISLDVTLLFALTIRWPGGAEESPYEQAMPPRAQPAARR